jgi:hypothetical protein
MDSRIATRKRAELLAATQGLTPTERLQARPVIVAPEGAPTGQNGTLPVHMSAYMRKSPIRL